MRPRPGRPMLGAVPAAPPPGFEEIQAKELSRLFGRLVGTRLLTLPVALALAAAIAFLDPARWRTTLLVALLATVGSYFVLEAIRYRRAGFRAEVVFTNLLATVLAQVALCLATGALESPLLVTFVPLAVMIGIFGPAGRWVPLVAVQLAGVWGLAALELAGAIPDLQLAGFGGGARGGHSDAHLVTSAVVLSLVLLLGARAGRGVRRAFDAMLARALTAQQDALRLHAERTEELTALSGEIAHELKNPLASVKGLAALLAESVAPGKPAERLSVLRREVERMQGILDEFLNFSRPLVPLALGRVDLAAVAAEVAAMHEGMAHERGVEVELRGEHAIARCDPRKVKQVLVNLVQNGLDASRPGSVLELEVRSDGDRAAVAVHDRGTGLDPALAHRAFDAGVTSKDSGFGLGLTIARALARQHGGDVELGARAGGGCSAVLTLPAEPGASPRRELAR
jgi:two-component system, NtrC family, sensor histidine kinase HydH